MKNNFAQHYVPKLALFILCTFFLNAPALAVMENYCASPAFLGQNIAPNIMVVLDNSGSMCFQAYGGGYNPSQFEAGVYYGYFDGNTNYRYNGSKWVPTSEPMNNATLDHPIAKGSFLNWATMRRVDVAKKVLIGGKAIPRTYEGNEHVTLYGELCPKKRFAKKPYTNDPDLLQPISYQDCTFGMPKNSNAELHITCSGGVVHRFKTIVDQGTTDARGVIDELASQVRFGLTFFKSNTEGGRIEKYNRFNAGAEMVPSITQMAPGTWTPLAETLYEVVRYFRQDNPYYTGAAGFSPGSGDFTGTDIFRDPFAYKFTDIDPTLSDQYVRCAKSFVLFLTDGESTKDRNIPSALRGKSAEGGLRPDGKRYAGTDVGQPYSYDGSDYMIDVAYWARTEDMRPGNETDTPTTWRKSLPGMQNIVLYPVFLFGSGSTMLKDAAIYGGFADLKDIAGNTNNMPDCNIRPAECFRDSNGNGVIETDGSDLPLTYYESSDGYILERDLKKVIMEMLDRATSGTGASVLGSQEGAGVVALQSVFYPQRTFKSFQDLTWIGDVMNYWYYLDPYLGNTQVREDSLREGTDYTLLDLKNDFIADFRFDASPNQQKTFVDRCRDDDGNGSCDTAAGSVVIEESKPIWRAGLSLWWTEPSDRTIWTSLDGVNFLPFETVNAPYLKDYLGQSDDLSAGATVEYVRGQDGMKLCSISRTPCFVETDCSVSGEVCASTRSRTATIKVCSTSKTLCETDADCGSFGGICAEETHTWKLGDIVSSTPRLLGPSPLNNYDQGIPRGYNDWSYEEFITTNAYKERGTVFAGSNDGMFHAFKLGKLLHDWSGKEWWQIGRIEGSVGTPGSIGTENWAFIPRNALPYLQYLSREDYDHIYTVDGPVVVADISIHVTNPIIPGASYWEYPKTKDSWRTVVVSSMGIGGATCQHEDSPPPVSTCIGAPHKVGSASAGLSSYFALDVTNQNAPELLWEFPGTTVDTSSPELGATNVGPAIIKVGGSEKRCSLAPTIDCSVTPCGTGDGTCEKTNGRWFAVLASGPTGPIYNKNYLGTSDQNLTLFILDLKTGELVRTIDTGINNAFAGSLSSNSIDIERYSSAESGHYKDDAVYIGYAQNIASAVQPYKGGVLRLLTGDDLDPNNWVVSKVIEDTGPVTSSVVNLLDIRNDELWLFFGEGRYYHKQDDLLSQRRVYGLRETCYRSDPAIPGDEPDLDTSCMDTIIAGTADFDMRMKDQSISPTELQNTQIGWYINLDGPIDEMGAERIISNPTVSPLGAVYFVSFQPNNDICGLGGTTYTWAIDYDSGMAVDFVQEGKALVQTSTGAVNEVDLGNAFTDKGNRRTIGMPGVPPAGTGPVTIINPLPVKKFMHVQEE